MGILGSLLRVSQDYIKVWARDGVSESVVIYGTMSAPRNFPEVLPETSQPKVLTKGNLSLRPAGHSPAARQRPT